jgi:deoxycytidylate deaminase
VKASWDETWMAVADAIAERSACSRAHVGAVIVTRENRIVATGYNGPAAGDDRACGECPYAVHWPDLTYSDCLTIHAEANALSFCDRSDREGGTLYINGASCIDCAKLVANSGLRRVHMRVNATDAHRRPRDVVEYWRRCRLQVTWDGDFNMGMTYGT